MSKQLETVEVRHDHIGDDNVRGEALDALDSLSAIGRRIGDVAPARHHFAETLPRRFFIVHYEHTLIGHRRKFSTQGDSFRTLRATEPGRGAWPVERALNELSAIFA